MMSLKDSDQGFSLIETLIAIIILGIIMAGGLAFYYQASALYYRSVHTQTATWLADSRMEICKSVGAANLPGGDCLAETDTVLPGAIQGLDAQRTTAINNVIGQSYKDVVVSVRWTERGEPAGSNGHTVKLETYVS